MLDYVLHHPGRALRAIATDPLGLWDTLQDKIVEKREYNRPQPQYVADPEWEKKTEF